MRSTIRYGLLALLVGCSAPPSGPHPDACRNYIRCFVLTGGQMLADDPRYGPAGSCWMAPQPEQKVCLNECQGFFDTLKASHPDAGC